MHLLFRLPLLAIAALPAAAAAAALQPGLYEISLQLMMRGTPLQLPARTLQSCLTPREIVNGGAYAVSETGQFCTVSRLQQYGDQVNYHFVCATAGGGRMVGQARGTRHAAGYDILMSGRFVPSMEGMSEFTQKIRATRIGGCTPGY